MGASLDTMPPVSTGLASLIGGERKNGQGSGAPAHRMANLGPASRWTIARRIAGAWLRDRRQFSGGKLLRSCPIRGHRGGMIGVGHPPRWDARRANCGSRERHRLLWLWATENGQNRLAGKRILHFAPEKALRRALGGNPTCETADLRQRGVTHQVDITCLPMADASYDVVIANHVLEHIDDDQQAMRELFRVLRPYGIALLTVPLNPTRQGNLRRPWHYGFGRTAAHFNAPDHRRYYGLDFADRLGRAGFEVETFRMTQAQEVMFSLMPMAWFYVATKPA
jgi:predicted SAM-dependent methyltransferase